VAEAGLTACRKDRGIAAPVSQELFLCAVFAALPVGVGRVPMRFGGMLVGLGGLLVTLVVFALPVMLRSSPMGLGGILMMLGSFRMGFFWHFRSFANGNRPLSVNAR
jgi:hypothetical protein